MTHQELKELIRKTTLVHLPLSTDGRVAALTKDLCEAIEAGLNKTLTTTPTVPTIIYVLVSIKEDEASPTILQACTDEGAANVLLGVLKSAFPSRHIQVVKTALTVW